MSIGTITVIDVNDVAHVSSRANIAFRKAQQMNVPRADHPFVDIETGHIDPQWHRFLRALWYRTGGTSPGGP